MFGLAQADLRARVIASIQVEGAFDMQSYKPSGEGPPLEIGLGCGTACCIAGHIVVQAYGLKAYSAMTMTEVPYMAYQAWAAAYGTEEAMRLQFDSYRWGGDLEAVTPEEAVAHLLGADPIYRPGF